MKTSKARRVARRFAIVSTMTIALVVMLGSTAEAQTGRAFRSDDWSDKIPIVIGAIFVVIAVNSVGMYFVKRSSDNDREAGLS